MNSMVSLPIVAALPVAAPAMPKTADNADPIFAAIENHPKCYDEMQAVFTEHRRVHALADSQVGPSHIEVPSRVEPGTVVEATCGRDIEKAIPFKKIRG